MSLSKLPRSITAVGIATFIWALQCTAQTTFTIATEYPETAMPGEGLNTFANAVKKLSNDKLIFTPSFDAKAGYKSS